MPHRPRARKRFGQHFLERAWVDKLIRAIGPRGTDTFLEIGPGRGALTRPLAAAAGCVLAGVLLMLRPLIAYVQTHTVADWMIYRFLVSSLAAQVAFLLLGAGLLSARIASIAMHEEVLDRRTPFSAWLRTGWFWSVAASLTGAGLILVWPSAVELWKTGKTDVHWSRFVVAMGCFGSVAVGCVIRGLDRVLDLVEERVQYLWK